MQNPTSTTPPTSGNPPIPDWACRTLTALRDATVYGRGEGRLTEAEYSLISAVMYRLSHRVGEVADGSTNLYALGAGMIHFAAKEIADEATAAAREVTP